MRVETEIVTCLFSFENQISSPIKRYTEVAIQLVLFVLFSICFEWVYQDF